MGTQFYPIDTTRTRTIFDGTQVPVRIDLPWEDCLDLNVRSAAALFALFGAALHTKRTSAAFNVQNGSMEIADARRLVMACRARFDSVGPKALGLALEAFDFGGDPGPRVVLGPDFGLEDLRDRLERFATFVEKAAAAGANAIRWS